eukprot:gene10551-1919_t
MAEPVYGMLKKTHGFFVAVMAFEVLIVIMFAAMTDYDESALGTVDVQSGNYSAHSDPNLNNLYPAFQGGVTQCDVRCKLYVTKTSPLPLPGPGHLPGSTRPPAGLSAEYGYGAVGFTFFIGAMAIQWSVIIRYTQTRGSCAVSFAASKHVTEAMWHGHWSKATIGLESLIAGDFAAGCVSRFCRTDILQHTVPITWLRSINELIVVESWMAVDIGGTLVIHGFGAYFGVGVSAALSYVSHRPSAPTPAHENQAT